MPAMSVISNSIDVDSDQENNHTNITMSKRTPQERKVIYRNLLNKVECIGKYLFNYPIKFYRFIIL